MIEVGGAEQNLNFIQKYKCVLWPSGHSNRSKAGDQARGSALICPGPWSAMDWRGHHIYHVYLQGIPEKCFTFHIDAADVALKKQKLRYSSKICSSSSVSFWGY